MPVHAKTNVEREDELRKTNFLFLNALQKNLANR